METHSILQHTKVKKADTRKMALEIAAAALEKKAEGMLVLDVREITYIADYFIICSGSNTRQVKAITEEIDYRLSKDGVFPSHVEGFPDCRWVLMDYGDVIVHVFDEEARFYYDLEGLWGEAERVSV